MQHRTVTLGRKHATMRAEDSLLRLERFVAVCRERGIDLDSPSALHAAFGRRPSFWSDLLAGRKSFGEKLARALETQMNLPRGYLDLVSHGHPKNMGELNGFEGQAVTLFRQFTHDQQHELLRTMQAALDAARKSAPTPTSH